MEVADVGVVVRVGVKVGVGVRGGVSGVAGVTGVGEEETETVFVGIVSVSVSEFESLKLEIY